MRNFIWLFVVLLIFLAWRSMIETVDQSQVFKVRGDRNGSVEIAESPSLLSRDRSGAVKRRDVKIPMRFSSEVAAYLSGSPFPTRVDIQVGMRADGRMEAVVPASVGLEDAKILVNRTQAGLVTMITTVDGEIITHEGNTMSGWFAYDPYSSSARTGLSAHSEYEITKESSGENRFIFDLAPFIDTRSLSQVSFDKAKTYAMSIGMISSENSRLMTLGEFPLANYPELLKPLTKE